MSHLTVYADTHNAPISQTSDPKEIAVQLAALGVRFEQWEANQPLSSGADQDEVLQAYREDVDRIMAESGFQSVDVVGLTPDHPQREAFRAKFLEEHTHAEFEIRFFVEGSGQFNLHLDGKVVSVVCTQGDLISVPAGTPHWFDMGAQPHFQAIRFFTNPEGWVAAFTGSDIAQRYPRFETAA